MSVHIATSEMLGDCGLTAQRASVRDTYRLAERKIPTYVG